MKRSINRVRSTDHDTKNAQVIAAGDLTRLLRGKTAMQHRRDQVHPARVVLDATSCIELVGADADVIDADNVGHLLDAVDVFVEAREEVPDANRAARRGDGPRVVGADLPAG